MPAHTPSPHRFLAPKAPSTQQPKPKPRSNLRNVIAAPANTTPKLSEQIQDDQPVKSTPAKRFLVTPHRRTLSAEEHASVQRAQAPPSQSTHTQLTPRPKPRRKFERVESIEEPQSSPSHVVDDNGFGSAQSIEHDPSSPTPTPQIPLPQDDEDEEMLFALPESEIHTSKRRRLTTPPSPTSTHRSAPTTPVTERNAATHRFLVPPPRTPAIFFNINQTLATETPSHATPAPQTASTRPHFILPPQPTSPPKPTKPLPEIFSPSRKTGRYIPGGLASTMQSLIIETANTGIAAQDCGAGIVWGRDKEDGVRMKVRITQVSRGKEGSHNEDEEDVECFPGHVVFVKGTTEPGLYNVSRAPSVVEDGGKMKVLLAGQGGARGVGGVRIKIGAVVGVRAPMWDVEVAEEKWFVGVDWVILC